MSLFRLRRLLLVSFLLASPLAAPPAWSAELPANVHIVFDLIYGDGNMRVGRAEEHWHTDAGHYELETEIVPIIGPHVRYLSRGRITPAGLVPDTFAEFRNAETEPRITANFDWDAMTVRYGKPDDMKSSALERGAQDLNALAFQLSFLGDKAAGMMQIATGKKVAHYNFSAGAKVSADVNGRSVSAQPWRSADSSAGASGTGRTEVWVARQLDNLPVRVIRVDEDKQLQLVARNIEFGPTLAKAP